MPIKKSTSSPTTYIDPVCLMNVDPATKDYTFTYRMRTYYFCAEACSKPLKQAPSISHARYPAPFSLDDSVKDIAEYGVFTA